MAIQTEEYLDEKREYQRIRRLNPNVRKRDVENALRWRRENPEQFKKTQRLWEKKNRKKRNEQRCIRRLSPEVLKRGKEQRLKIKMKVIAHYSNGTMKCANPFGIDHSSFEEIGDYIRLLQIDHIEGKGTEHRKSIGIKNGGITFYYWLINNGFPEGFQVLCANCNWLKRHRYKER